MTTRRRRLFGATAVVALVASMPFLAAQAVVGLADRPAAVIEAIDGIPDPVTPGPGCLPRGRAVLPSEGEWTEGERSEVVAEGARVSSATVLHCPEAMDGRRVTFVGEVVGDVLRRRGGAWVLVNDDDYALRTGPLPLHGTLAGTNSGLPVWLPEDLLDGLSEPGRPGRRGDIVLVTGRILRTDPEDAGGLTLRAETLTIVAAGVDVDEPLDVPRLALAVAFVGLGLLVRLRRGRA